MDFVAAADEKHARTHARTHPKRAREHALITSPSPHRMIDYGYLIGRKAGSAFL